MSRKSGAEKRMSVGWLVGSLRAEKGAAGRDGRWAARLAVCVVPAMCCRAQLGAPCRGGTPAAPSAMPQRPCRTSGPRAGAPAHRATRKPCPLARPTSAEVLEKW